MKKQTPPTQPSSLITRSDVDSALKAYDVSDLPDSERRRYARMNAAQVWQRDKPWCARWIYNYWQHFNPAIVETGITPEQLAESIRRCRYTHTRKELAWVQLRAGTLAYIEYVLNTSMENVRAVQQAFVHGDVDVQGVRWCGLCHDRYRLMTLGKHCGYACLHDIYSVCGREVIGYEAWLQVASECSIVRAGTAVWLGEKLYGKWDAVSEQRMVA